MSQALRTRVAQLEKVFDFAQLTGRGEHLEDIVKYYEQSRVGYRLMHSMDGSIHMSLSESGAYQASGLYRVIDLIQERFPPRARQVLELGAGNGFNLRCLATRTPSIEYLGIDLVNSHVRSGNRALYSTPNARLEIGNFEELRFSDNRFDGVFAVESLCHALNIQKVLGEGARVLRPGGRFIVADAWRTGKYDDADGATQRAVEMTERAMSVGHAATQGAWLNVANKVGLDLLERIPLRKQVMPNLVKFETWATLAIERPWLGSLGRRFLSPHLAGNIVAAYLMAQTVRDGLHTYDMLMLEKSL